MPGSSKARAVILSTGVLVILLVHALRLFQTTDNPKVFRNPGPLMPSEIGSEHSHASFLIVINGKNLDFSDSTYSERGEYAHLHDRNGFYIHKHAEGVSLSFFLNTLGIKLTSECLALDTGVEYCTSQDNKLLSYVNRKLFTDNPDYYELQDGDKILIDYGTSSAFQIGLELNSIPDLTPDLLQNE